MDIYYLDINHCWTCIIWTYYLDYWTHPIVGHWTPSLTLSNIGHHLINIIITYQFTI